MKNKKVKPTSKHIGKLGRRLVGKSKMRIKTGMGVSYYSTTLFAWLEKNEMVVIYSKAKKKIESDIHALPEA